MAMARITIILLLIASAAFAQDYCDGWKKGYVDGWCFEDQLCVEPVPPRCPVPKLGLDEYDDGYQRGFVRGRKNRESGQRVTATVYNAVPGQTDSTPLITASGARINPNDPQRWIAVSRDLEPLGFTFGARVCIENAGSMNGIWTVQDRMNRRWNKRIDFLVHHSIRLGKWRGVKIRLI